MIGAVGGLARKLDDVERASRVAARAVRDQLYDVVGCFAADLAQPAANDDRHLLGRERLELVHLRARDEGGVDLVVRVLGGGPDQRHEPRLDAGEQRVLLRLVEAVDLVEEEDRAPARRAERLACPRENLAHVLDRRGHGRQLLERRARRRGDDPRERRLAAAGRAVQDRGVHAILLDRVPQGRALAEHVLLPDELGQGRRSKPLGQRRNLAAARVRRVREEVTHDLSMLPRVSGAEVWSGASYERIAETFAPIHDRVVETLALEPGAPVLDVACGTGGVALRAARVGADVTGIDISADQVAKARRAAAAGDLAVRFDEGDCQELPYADAEFDAVASVFGAIFAPDHRRTAAELARVCRPGGRLALTAWQKDAFSDLHTEAGRPQYDVDARRVGKGGVRPGAPR